MPDDMKWLPAEGAKIATKKRYLVKTNGAEWSDPDYGIWPGAWVERRLRSEYVRGRPLFIAEIIDPQEPSR